MARFDEERFVLAGNSPRDLAWLRAHAVGDVEIEPVTDARAYLALWGPLAREILRADRGRRPVERRVPVPGRPDHPDRRHRGRRRSDLLRRRARVGALVRRERRRNALGRGVVGGNGPRSGRGGSCRARDPPPREGLSRVGHRHDPRRRAGRRRPRLRGPHDRSRLHRRRCARDQGRLAAHAANDRARRRAGCDGRGAGRGGG